jgi:hypothetical protein
MELRDGLLKINYPAILLVGRALNLKNRIIFHPSLHHHWIIMIWDIVSDKNIGHAV